jgi:hypothetical protein
MACHGNFGHPGFRGSFGRPLSLYLCLSSGSVLISDLVDQIPMNSLVEALEDESSVVQAKYLTR